MDGKTGKVLSQLEAQCSRREYCSLDIEAKALKALDGDRDAVSEVLESLVKNKFVDDRRYACAFAREKSSITGWGPVKIRIALSAKGISGEIADEALEEIDGGKAHEKLEKTLRSRWRTLAGDPQAKFKLIKFALGRGYGYDDIRELVDEICRG